MYPVGSFPTGASWCGALDLAGNVWEWCRDWYDGGYYRDSSHIDPDGPPGGEYRVARGGSWHPTAGDCRSTIRHKNLPTSRNIAGGFRPMIPPK